MEIMLELTHAFICLIQDKVFFHACCIINENYNCNSANAIKRINFIQEALQIRIKKKKQQEQKNKMFLHCNFITFIEITRWIIQ